MPLPLPKEGMSSKEFIKSCMSSEVMKREFPNHKQRLAVCFSQARKARGKDTLTPKLGARFNTQAKKAKRR